MAPVSSTARQRPSVLMGAALAKNHPYFLPPSSTHLVQESPRTPPGFPVARGELDVPLAPGFVTDEHAALVQHFLDGSVAEREAVIEPDSVLDNRHGKSVAVGFGIGHSGSAYPSPMKATQPIEDASWHVRPI